MSNLDQYLSVYDTEIELPGSGKKLIVTPLTTNQLKKLLVYENEDNPLIAEEIIDLIISSTVKTENFNIDKLFLQDKYYLFVQIRRITKGDMYSFFYNCPECQTKNIQNVNLDDLSITKPPKQTDNTVKILNDQLTLKLGYITRGEQKKIYNIIENVKKSSTSQIQLSMTMASLTAAIKEISTPNGIENFTLKEKMDFIEKLPQPEYKKINDWFEKNNFGIQLNFHMKCSNCGCERYEALPVDNFFG